MTYSLAYSDPTRVNQFLTFSSVTGEISLETSDASLISDYTLTWTISYANYPSVTYTGTSFKVSILPCVITEIVPPTNTLDDINLQIGIDIEETVFNSFTQFPLCDYDLEYYLLID